jgi:hypothetical protein
LIIKFQAYGDVISEMNNKTSFESRRIHHEDPEIHTIVPSGDSKRVVLISSKSRGSDWDLTMVKDEQDSNNGVESEDSGFQLDADSSSIKIIAPAPVNDATAPADMTVTTQKVDIPLHSYVIGGRCFENLFRLCQHSEWDDRD